MRLKSLIFVGGLAFALACNKTAEEPLTPEEQLAIDIGLIDQYLDDNGITAVEHESGLRWVIQTEGTGEYATSNDCINIDYSGRLLYETTPFETNTGFAGSMSSSTNQGFILGWRIGMKQVRKGGTITLYIPSGYAYGTGEKKREGEVIIPRNSILVFDVTLNNITKYNSAGQYCYPWPS